MAVVITGCRTLILPKFSLLYSLKPTSLPPDMIYLKCQEKYYWCFYGILRQLLLMSPLDFATTSGAPMFLQRLRHAGKPYTVRGERGDAGWVCVVLGGTDSAPYQTASLPCPTTTGQQRLPKPKLYFPEMKQRQLKLAQSDWEIVQNTVGHVRTVQRCDSKWCLSCFRCVGARQIQLALPWVERTTTLCDRLIHKVWYFVNFKGEIWDIRWRQQQWMRAAVCWDVNRLVRG